MILIDKIHACLLLSIIGDKIGFDNGNREFYALDKIPNKNSSLFTDSIINLSTYMIFEFIKNGGISNINTKELSYSDDSILLISNIETYFEKFNKLSEYLKLLVERYLYEFENESIMINKYKCGIHTLNSIRLLKTNINWKNRNYEINGGGSGGCMKSSIYGLLFNHNHKLKKLAKYSIYSCIITHMNGIAIIGSFLNALITSYALNNIDIEEWLFKGLEIIKGDLIDNIIKNKFNHIYENYLLDKKTYINLLELYLEQNFKNRKYIININREINFGERIYYYYKNFSNKNSFFPGSNSNDSIIISYDCLLLARNNYEKLIYYSMINLGDSDTIGIISSGWYGAYYGFYKNLEFIYKNDNYYNLTKNLSEKINNVLN